MWCQFSSLLVTKTLVQQDSAIWATLAIPHADRVHWAARRVAHYTGDLTPWKDPKLIQPTIDSLCCRIGSFQNSEKWIQNLKTDVLKCIISEFQLPTMLTVIGSKNQLWVITALFFNSHSSVNKNDGRGYHDTKLGQRIIIERH